MTESPLVLTNNRGVPIFHFVFASNNQTAVNIAQQIIKRNRNNMSTKIEWTDKTWNPITGCTKKSAGCAHCYAEVMANRIKNMGLAKYRNGFSLTLHDDDLEEPLHWKKDIMCLYVQ